nr:FGGY family carbohydrate kinase [Corynebacterium diphtheriae]
MNQPQYVAAIDQGTTSTRCIIFAHNGQQVGVGQYEHEQIFPQKSSIDIAKTPLSLSEPGS